MKRVGRAVMPELQARSSPADYGGSPVGEPRTCNLELRPEHMHTGREQLANSGARHLRGAGGGESPAVSAPGCTARFHRNELQCWCPRVG